MNRREKATRENGEQWRYDYNARGEVTSGVKAKDTATNAALRTGMQFGYGYDLIGNRIEESVHTPAGLAVQDWTANAGNQITQREIASSRWLLGRVHPEADLTVTGGGTAQREDWEFAVPVESSPAGAATWKQVTVAATREGAGENGADVEGTLEGNQWFAANPENMTYDADGNLSSDGRWSYQWDGENRLKVMQTQPGAKAAGVPARRLEFAYDAQGRRIRKLVQSFELAEGPYTTIKDHRYIYDGWNMVAEFEVQGSPELTGAYAWGRDISGTMTGAGGVGGLVLAQKPKTGWTYAPCYDGNGNVSAYVSAASGAVRAKFDYDLYGRPIWNELAGGEELPAYRFSTKYEDVETGLLYYGYRYYSPEMGRWISRDPIGEHGGINIYGMVGNDVVNRLDYIGLLRVDSPTMTVITWQEAAGVMVAGAVAELFRDANPILIKRTQDGFLDTPYGEASFNDSYAEQVKNAIRMRVECPCLNKNWTVTGSGGKPLLSLAVFSRLSLNINPRPSKLPDPYGWKAANTMHVGLLDRAHLVAHSFGGKDTQDNLITAFSIDNQLKMVEVERRINELSLRHRSVCMAVTPVYRKYTDGVADVPKYVRYNVVTSEDGVVEHYHTQIQMKDMFRLDLPSLFNSIATMTPLN